jgi:MFS family permease
MPFPTVLLFLFVAASSVVAVVCLLGGLIAAALPRFRRKAPYLALVYPAAYLGCLLGYVRAVVLNRWLFSGRGPGWVIWIEALFAVLAPIIVGICSGAVGLVLANRISERIPRRGLHRRDAELS